MRGNSCGYIFLEKLLIYEVRSIIIILVNVSLSPLTRIVSFPLCIERSFLYLLSIHLFRFLPGKVYFLYICFSRKEENRKDTVRSELMAKRKRQSGRAAISELLGRKISRTEYNEYVSILETRGLSITEVLSSEELELERSFMLLWFTLNNKEI